MAAPPAPPAAAPPLYTVPTARGTRATIRDPAPCGLDRSADALKSCLANASGAHGDLERLILGDFAGLGLGNNYDNPNQTARYDVLNGLGALSTPSNRQRVQGTRSGWLRAGTIAWRTAPPVIPANTQRSGLIYVTSGRADWFAEHGLTSPFVMWCLATGRHCDVVTDCAEYDHYLRAFTKFRAGLAVCLETYAATHGHALLPAYATWEAQIGAHLTLTAPASIGGDDLQAVPRGFGFNRWVGMEWMRVAFDGICATVDDNTFRFKSRFTAPAMEWLYSGQNLSNRIAAIVGPPAQANNWLALAFAPCTAAVESRGEPDAMRNEFGALQVYTGGGIKVNSVADPRIIQQMTLWNASLFATQGVNYDQRLVTGKEDVEFFRRLQGGAQRNLLFHDNSLHLEKCTAAGKPNMAKERAINLALLAAISDLSPCFGRAVALLDSETLKRISDAFYGNAAPAPVKFDGNALAALLRRINMALEQLLVPKT